LLVGHRGLVHEQGQRLDGQVRLDHGDEGTVPGAGVASAVAQAAPTGPVAVTEHGVDMRRLRASPT